MPRISQPLGRCTLIRFKRPLQLSFSHTEFIALGFSKELNGAAARPVQRGRPLATALSRLGPAAADLEQFVPDAPAAFGGQRAPDRKRKSPPPGGNRGTSRPHLAHVALRGTTWHKINPYM